MIQPAQSPLGSSIIPSLCARNRVRKSFSFFSILTLWHSRRLSYFRASSTLASSSSRLRVIIALLDMGSLISLSDWKVSPPICRMCNYRFAVNDNLCNFCRPTALCSRCGKRPRLYLTMTHRPSCLCAVCIYESEYTEEETWRTPPLTTFCAPSAERS